MIESWEIVFLGMYSFPLGCPIRCLVFTAVSYNPLGFSANVFSFISGLSPLFLGESSYRFVIFAYLFQESALTFVVSIWFVSTLIFIKSFPLLTLGFVKLRSFSSFRAIKTMILLVFLDSQTFIAKIFLILIKHGKLDFKAYSLACIVVPQIARAQFILQKWNSVPVIWHLFFPPQSLVLHFQSLWIWLLCTFCH